MKGRWDPENFVVVGKYGVNHIMTGECDLRNGCLTLPNGEYRSEEAR